MTKEIIYKTRNLSTKENTQRYDFGKVFDLYELIQNRIYTPIAEESFKGKDEELFRLLQQAPNLTVNAPGGFRGSVMLAMGAGLTQGAVLLIAGIITFHYQLLKPSRPFSPLVAYVLFGIGEWLMVTLPRQRIV